MKKIVSFLLALVLIVCLIPSAMAATPEQTGAADTLYAMGLFKGTGMNPDGTPVYALDNIPTRNQAIIMLVRLLGKENEALEGDWEIPFTDVADSMRPYVGYAYTHGLTNGTSATTYSGANPIRANQYITFVLRALGYASETDFTVGDACAFSDEIGLTDGQYSAESAFTRGDVAAISASALDMCLKGTKETLLTKLVFEGSIQTNNFVKKTAGDAMQVSTSYPNENTGSYYPQWDYCTIDFNKPIDKAKYPTAYLYNLTEGTVQKLKTQRGISAYQCLLVLFDGKLKLDHEYCIYIPANTIYSESGDAYSSPVLMGFKTAENVVRINLGNRAKYLSRIAVLEGTDGSVYQARVNNGTPPLTFVDVAPGEYTLHIQGEVIGTLKVGTTKMQNISF